MILAWNRLGVGKAFGLQLRRLIEIRSAKPFGRKWFAAQKNTGQYSCDN